MVPIAVYDDDDDDDNKRGHGLLRRKGFTLHHRFLGLLHWVKQHGLAYALTTRLTLIIYWHPETGGSDTHNTLYKVALGMWIAVPEEDILKRHREGIVKAMKAGQTKAVVCYLFENYGYKESPPPPPPRSETNSLLECNETKSLFTDKVIGTQRWLVDVKHQPLLEWLTHVEQLKWSLRFLFRDETSAALYPWALLIAYW
jgi:hypothetical protein